MRILLAAFCGFGLDLLLGDPEKLAPLHPVVLMGKAIQALETGLRARFPAAERGELAAGRVLAALLPLGTLCISALLLRLLLLAVLLPLLLAAVLLLLAVAALAAPTSAAAAFLLRTVLRLGRLLAGQRLRNFLQKSKCHV